MSAINDVVKYGAIALAGWWLYQKFSPTVAAAPADVSAGKPAAPPQPNTAAPRAAPPVVPAVAPPAPGPATVMSLADAAYRAMVAAAQADGVDVAAGTSRTGSKVGPDEWNWYFFHATPGKIDAMPDPTLVFPGVDRMKPMSAAVYWASMGPYLHSLYSGLFGLGHFASVGRLYALGCC